MSWTKAYNGVRDKVIRDDLNLVQLETLTRRIPIAAQDEHHGIVGAALESVLRDRYRVAWELWDDAAVFAAGHRHEGDTCADRVERARTDAACRILEGRHPGEPFDSYPYADDVQNAPEGSWRAHLRTFYGIAS